MVISKTSNKSLILVPPRVVEIIILIVYIGTILTGTILGDDYFPPSYFSKKHNLVNKFLAKKAWLWTTIVFILHYVSSFYLVSTSQPQNDNNNNNNNNTSSTIEQVGDSVPQDQATLIIKTWRKRVWLRYFIQSGYFILFTQWCFGPPIMDKVFWWTGGACMVVAETAKSGFAGVNSPSYENKMAKYSSHCRQIKGSWQGGHDPSGHVFLLVHASLFLWYEVLPILEATPIRGSPRKSLPWGSKSVLILIAIWWWVLAMTCVYFHTVYEKISGGFAGFVGWGLVYIAPRYLPLLQELFYGN